MKHARKEPNVPLPRIASLYEVNITTLRRRLAGTQVSNSIAKRDEQLFSPGEEQAIAEHCGVMADLGFPVTKDLLQQIAQDMLNSGKQPQKGQGGTSGKPTDRRTKRIHRQGAVIPTEASSSTASDIHIIGAHWVDRFLKRNPTFKGQYIRYQERARKAAENDIASQTYFLRLLANLVRRCNVQPDDIWNCNEKGIIMGRNQIRTVAIVRASTKKGTVAMMTEASREFCTVLDTISAAGRVIPPFIVWKGKTHRDTYYKDEGEQDATFAVSDSGYMDDELGFLYISKHFEPHTRTGRPRILIVDGHSSHICWPVIQHALDHDIHVIQLPSKSTHLLQPLNVGCFALLQKAYERYLREWLLENPLFVIRKVDFLSLLFKAPRDTYAPDIVRKAWKSARCWPIDLDCARGDIPNTSVQKQTSSFDQKQTSALDTPLLIRNLASDAEQAIFGKGKGKGKANAMDDVPTKRELFHAVIDTAMAKLTTYRDIEPRATTLSKLRNGKVCKKKVGSRQVGHGGTRVFTRAELNAGLKKLEIANRKTHMAEQAKADRKRHRKAACSKSKLWKISGSLILMHTL